MYLHFSCKQKHVLAFAQITPSGTLNLNPKTMRLPITKRRKTDGDQEGCRLGLRLAPNED